MRVGFAQAGLRNMADRMDRDLLDLHGHDRIEHIDVDTLRHTRALTVQQCRQHPFERGIGRHRVDKILARGTRRFAIAPNAEHGAAHGLQQQVLPGSRGIGPRLTVARHRDINQLRVDRLERVVVDTQTRGDTGPVILQKHIGRAHEIEQHGLALRRFQIDGKAALVPVQRQKRHVDPLPFRIARRLVALPLARGRFDLDHIRAQITEALCGKWPRHRNRAVKDSIAGKDGTLALSHVGAPGKYRRKHDGSSRSRQVLSYVNIDSRRYDAGAGIPTRLRVEQHPASIDRFATRILCNHRIHHAVDHQGARVIGQFMADKADLIGPS